jgi:hypothetical protein
MELATLISPEEAAERLKVYEAQLAGERTVEDDAVRAGYRAAARGLPVIHLPQVVEAGGWFPNGLPRLAVVRADATECWVRVTSPSSGVSEVVFADDSWDRGRAAVGQHRVAVTVPSPQSFSNRPWRARTIVPSIPPNHRPRRTRLHRFHILWEVEKWAPVPPRDPALLRHLRGDLWTVEAVWDLTDLERAVLSGRVRA